MIKEGDICVLHNVKGAAHQVIASSKGAKVKVTHTTEALCWIKFLDGEYLGHELPCLSSRLKKHEVGA